MAQQTIFLGTNANDGTGESLRGGGTMINSNFTELYALQSSTINAGAIAYAAATNHGRVQLAIDDAVLLGKTRVFVPAQYLPYDASQVTFNSTVQMTREGGDASVYDVQAYGASPTQTAAINRVAFQATLDAIPSIGGRVVANAGLFDIDQELQLRKDYTVLELIGTVIRGPVAGTTAGTLLIVGDRTTPSRVVNHVWIQGGVFRPRNALDNGIAVVSAENVVLNGVAVDLSTGLRGIVVQTDTTFTDPTPIRNVLVSNCHTYGGGTNSLNIESAGADNLIKNVVVNHCVFRNAQTAIRIVGPGAAQRLYRIMLSNCLIDTTGVGMVIAKITGLHVSATRLQNIAGGNNGIDCLQLRDAIFSDLSVISGATAGGFAFAFDDQSASGANVLLDGFQVGGSVSPAWTGGLLIAHADCTVRNGEFKDCSTHISTNGNTYRTTYENLTFQGSATLVSTIRSGDVYRNLSYRSGTTVTYPMQGRAVLVAGTVTVSTVYVLASDNITLTRVLAGGTLGHLSVGAIVAGTSFVINSSDAGDTSTIFWEIRH